MPLVKKEEPMPILPVIVLLYGMPGSGKTSVATTAKNPVIIDTDRGSQRAVQRVDTLYANNWEDIIGEYNNGTLNAYKTIVIDTAKGMLDDFIQDFVERKDERLKKNSLKRFGEMGDVFKDFVSKLQSRGCDLVFICHDKEEKDGDITTHSPDCTGQSKQLLVRKADQVGYVGYDANGKRTINFGPRYNFISKDVAELGIVPVPEFGTAEYSNFMEQLINSVKEKIASRDQNQKALLDKLSELRQFLAKADSEPEIETLLDSCKELPTIQKIPFFEEVKNELAKKGWTYDSNTKKFTKTAA